MNDCGTERNQGSQISLLILVLLASTLAPSNAHAGDLLFSQPTLWASKPDIAAFEKIEIERLAAAQRSVDAIVAVKSARTIENTLAPYDEATRLIDTTQYFADVMQSVHPDAAYRDHATRYVQRTLLAFRLGGVDKDDATRARLKKLNDQLTEDQSMFDRNIADGQRTVEVANASELDGPELRNRDPLRLERHE